MRRRRWRDCRGRCLADPRLWFTHAARPLPTAVTVPGRESTRYIHAMAGPKKLVIGASGFLGSHVTRQLVERGDDVRVLLRRTSSTAAIDDLDVERHYGDVFDDAALRSAMAGRRRRLLLRRRRSGVAARSGAAVPHQRRRPAARAGRGRRGGPAPVRVHQQHRHHRRYLPTTVPPPRTTRSTGQTRAAATFSPGWPRNTSCCLRPRAGTARRRDVRFEHLRSWRLAADAARRADRGGRRGQDARSTSRARPARSSASRTPRAAMLLAAEKGRDGERYIISERVMSARELYEVAAEAAAVETAAPRRAAVGDVPRGVHG